MTDIYDYVFKLIIIGDSCVGKSSIMNRMIDDKFNNEANLTTIGVDFKTKIMDINNKKIKLMIWDTAGQERFKAITASYYRNVHGVILVYDITNRESFNHLHKWLEDIDKYCRDNVTKVLVGNKTDISAKREVTFDEGKQLADDLGLYFIEVSAKTASCIEDIFVAMVNEISKDSSNLDTYQPKRPNPQFLVQPNIEKEADCKC